MEPRGELLGDAPVRGEFLGDAPVKGSVDVVYDESWLAYQEGKHKDALRGLARVLAIVPDYERAHFATGLCFLGLDQAADAERALSTYLNRVAYKQLNTCDALFFRAMAYSRLSFEQKALSDLDCAASSKPGCLAGCACGMSCRAAEAVLARFAMLLNPRVRAEYVRAQEAPVSRSSRRGSYLASASSSAEAGGSGSGGGDGEGADVPEFTYEGPTWIVPMHQLGDALDRAAQMSRLPLIVDASKEHAADTFFLYSPSTIVELKRCVVQLRTGSTTLAEVREQLRGQLVHAMRWGHNLVLRLGTSAPDFAKLAADDSFPLALIDDASSVPVGRNLVGHAQMGGVLRAADLQAGVFVVALGFRVVITCNFAADKFEGYLRDSLTSWASVQPICVVTETSFRDGKADPLKIEALSVADKAIQRQLNGDRTTLFLQS
jgi:hypothetical protein